MGSPFDGDRFVLEEIKRLVESEKIDTIVETGTFEADTTEELAKIVKNVVSIEIDESNYQRSVRRLHKIENIRLYRGSSPEVLDLILPQAEKPVLFYLDAHWGSYCPLLDELRVISECKIKDAVIVIHDFYVPGETFGFDSYGGQRYEWDYIKESIEKIYDSYEYYYNVKSEGARRGVIYIKPKSEKRIVWYAIPSANPERANRVLGEWKDMGYKTAALVDPGLDSVEADLVVVCEFEGYWSSINRLCRAIGTVDIVVAGGDDISPDPSKRAEVIADEFFEKFPNGLGVMQPMGDGLSGTDKICGSPWLGRGWIERAYGGRGPCPGGYKSYFGDEEILCVAERLGVLWRRKDLVQRHDHWTREGGPERTEYQKRNSDRNWRNDRDLFESRKSRNWPDSDLKGLNETKLVVRQRNVMLHTQNIWSIGGTLCYLYDFICAFPEYHHVVIYYQDWAEDYHMTEVFNNMGVEVFFVEKLTKEMLEDIDPSVVVMNNPWGKPVVDRLEGDWPWDWIKSEDRYILMIHHSPTRPLIKGDGHVFVSQHVRDAYANIEDQMLDKMMIPPVIQVGRYSWIKRSEKGVGDKCVIGRVSSGGAIPRTGHPENTQKYPMGYVDIMSKLRGNLEFWQVAGDIFKRHEFVIQNKDRWKFLPVSFEEVPNYLAGFDIFCMKTGTSIVETWCRTVTEAMAAGLPIVAENQGGIKEQVEHGVTGYLYDTDEDCVEYLQYLIDNPEIRLEMGLRAREWARENADVTLLRRELIPRFLRRSIGCMI